MHLNIVPCATGNLLAGGEGYPNRKNLRGVYKVITFQILKHCYRLKSAGVGMMDYAASSHVGVKRDKVKLCVNRKGNGFLEDLSLLDYFSSLLLLLGHRYTPCTVRTSLSAIHTSIFPCTTNFAKNVGRFTVLLQQLCST